MVSKRNEPVLDALDGSARRRGPYSKTPATRLRILEVAGEAFAAIGFHRTSLRMIADQVGMTVPGVLHHFAGKDEMLMALLEQRDEDDFAYLATVLSDPDLTFADALHLYARRSADRPDVFRMLTMISAESLDPEHPAHDYFKRRNERLMEVGRAMFDAAAARGLVDDGLDRDQSIVVVLALLEGLQLQLQRNPSLDLGRAIDHFVSTVRWNGAEPQGDPPPASRAKRPRSKSSGSRPRPSTT